MTNARGSSGPERTAQERDIWKAGFGSGKQYIGRMVRSALTDEDEVGHGEAWDDTHKVGLAVCAYCGDQWPCRTQLSIDRLLARLAEHSA